MVNPVIISIVKRFFIILANLVFINKYPLVFILIKVFLIINNILLLIIIYRIRKGFLLNSIIILNPSFF